MSRQLIFESDESLIYTETTGSGKQLIKIMRSEFPTAEQTLRFNNEYEYTVNLAIPGIRKAVAKRKEEDRNVLVLEYVEGVTLEEAFKKTEAGGLSTMLELFIKVAFSLGKLHEKGIIHKDINGSNILWDTAKAEPVIIDFGISCQLDLISSNMGNPEKVKGTLSHMAPEQTGRLNRQIDNRSDLYALGVTMFTILTGEHPFKSKDPLELVHMHIAMPAPALHDLNPELPEMLSVIITKLMAKNADDRYQTAFGLVHDLKACLEQYNSKKRIDVFETGMEDFSGHFRIPQKLYGRYDELKTIFKSFERVCKGNNEFLLVSGYSGIGKSALIMELYKPITEYKGFFAKGKFDQYQRNIPYFAIMQAFNEFCNLLLTENSDKLNKWKNNILEAVGDNGSVMTAFIPALEKIIGKQPEVPVLEAQEAQNRFRLVLHRFINAIAKQEHPFVLFIDDLQWADAASLGLIQNLVSDATNHYLMIIGAYRDNEVTAAHPLMNMINLAVKDKARLSTVELKPLREEHIFQLIKESLLASDAIVQELTEVIYAKTQGNAFFTIEFLKSLQQYELIKYNFDKKRWDVNFEAIHKRAISNNVVDLLVSKTSFLPEETRHALKFASCIGAVFSIQTLSFILNTDVKNTLKALWEAVRLGMLRPVGDSYQYVGFSEEDTMPEVEIEFAHDRIQQAFYSLMSDEQHKEVHLQIARLLFAHAEDNNLFDIVNHYNEALTLIDDTQERREVSELNFRAGIQARNSSAYQPALTHLNIAIGLSEEGLWEKDYPYALQLYKAISDVEYLNGNFVASEKYIATCLEHARTPAEKADIYFMLVQNQTNRAQYYEAIESARQGLRLLDFDFPEKDLCAALIPEQMGKVIAYFSEHGVQSVYDKPEMKDPKLLAIINILDNLSPPTYVTGETNMWILHVLFKANLTIEHGISPQGGYAFVELGLIFFIMNNYAFAYPSAQLSKRIAEKYRKESPRHLSRVGHLFTNYCTPWVKHISETARLNPEYYQVSLESGELVYAGYTSFYPHFNTYYQGNESLDAMLARITEGLEFTGKIHHDLAYDSLKALQMCMNNLAGKTASPSVFDLPEMTEADFLAHCIKVSDYYGMTMMHLFKSQAHYLSGDLAAALESLRATESLVAVLAGSATQDTTFRMIYALTLMDLLPEAAEQREAYLEKISAFRAQMKVWAEHNEANFGHKHLLLEAEWARIEGNTLLAFNYYNDAISAAEKNEYEREAALINLKAGAFWIAQGNKIYAQPHISKAHYIYKKLGYQRIVSKIEEQYTGFLSFPLRPGMATRTITGTNGMEDLDLSSIMKASHALSEEIVLDRLLEKMMRILLENAGAMRGAFILNRDGELFVEAEADKDEVRILKNCPVENFTGISLPAVYYVARTSEKLVIEDAQDQSYFSDPYITRSKVRSLLCSGIMHQGELIGILYLENNLTTAAFTRDRLEVLSILSSQAAISIENALLYENLEQKVSQRTNELNLKKEALEEAILDLKNAQIRLIQSEKMASLGQLTAGIAHEINNPVNFVSATIPSLRQDMDDIVALLGAYEDVIDTHGTPENKARMETLRKKHDPDLVIEEIAQLLKTMEEGSRRTAEIVSGLRNFSKLDSNILKPSDINAGLDDTLSVINKSLGSNISIVKKYAQLPLVYCYPGSLNQVFLNIFNNAVQALHGRGEILVETFCTEKNIGVHIRDNGVGMKEDVRSRMFDPFFTTRDVGMGKGLGLSIAYGIIDQHKGRIEVESAPGNGTSVYIYLPMALQEEPASMN